MLGAVVLAQQVHPTGRRKAIGYSCRALTKPLTFAGLPSFGGGVWGRLGFGGWCLDGLGLFSSILVLVLVHIVPVAGPSCHRTGLYDDRSGGTDPEAGLELRGAERTENSSAVVFNHN
ncbi:UNVERIFIED_CONTAM: hypothetical protein FKN15_023185 [Acipenser sinensis]